MPKGQKVNVAPPPATVHCDFCSHPFTPSAWNQRTCVQCEVAGAPDQSKLEWTDYQLALGDWQRKQGQVIKGRQEGRLRRKARSNASDQSAEGKTPPPTSRLSSRFSKKHA